MSEQASSAWEKTGGVTAETRFRDQNFVMDGFHCHSGYELFYVEAGACRFLADDSIFDLRAGDFVLVPPLALHYTRYLFGPCKRTVVYFAQEDVLAETMGLLSSQKSMFARTTVFQVPLAYQDRIGACLGRMVSEEKIHDARSPFLRKVFLQELLLLCGRVCIFLDDYPADLHTTDQQIVQAARYISERYMHPITTAEVAMAVGFSPNYLSRKFRRASGMGLHEYLVFIRLHHAAQELLSTQDSITTIAFRCGFSDSNYFKDAFKKKYGISPRNYRKMS